MVNRCIVYFDNSYYRFSIVEGGVGRVSVHNIRIPLPLSENVCNAKRNEIKTIL